jgi:diguanylate cyclase (GGDEF)-like protein/PAS domain S-box-containing protein
MPDGDLDHEEVALLVRRLDRQRRARIAAEAISEHATRALYDTRKHLMLLQSVAVSTNEAESFEEAVQTAIDQACEHSESVIGRYIRSDGESTGPARLWYINNAQRHESLRDALRLTGPTVLAQRAALEQHLVASRDIDAIVPPEARAQATESAIGLIFAVPVIAEERVIGVIECFSTATDEPDDLLIDVLQQIGQLLGETYRRKRAEATLRDSEQQYRQIFDASVNPMWVYDVDTLRFLAVNDAAVMQYGWTREQFLSMTIRDIRPPEEQEALDRELAGVHRQNVRRHRRADGRILQVEVSSQELPMSGHRARLVLAIDVTARRHAEDELRESERRFRELLQNVDLISVLLDPIGTITFCNKFLLDRTRYAKEEVIGRNWFDLFIPEPDRARVARVFHQKIADGSVAAHEENHIVTRGGDRLLVAWNNTVLRNVHGSVLGTASIGIDITAQRRAEQQLLHDAFHDALTGLPNRALFLDRLAQSLRRNERGTTHIAVLLLDLDRFKIVNDSLGHARGDELLIAIARRVESTLRPGDSAARFGGDEFTILLENLRDVSDATHAAARLLDELSRPFSIGGQEIYTTASIGVTIARQGDDPEHLLRDADTAMYRAKSLGKARFEIFDEMMRGEALRRLQLETDLRHAIERNELRVHYQPIVALESGRISGFEALVRWEHPTSGLLPPAAFIGIAEETGLIAPLGEQVLRQACRQAKVWNDARPDRPLTMNVNLSSRQFARNLVADVQQILEETELPASALTLEITETLLMENAETAAAMLHELKQLGCSISLDDFGTGYSSLSYLHRFPIDRLKIDRSFVRALGAEAKNWKIIRSITELAHSLDIDVTAEGVETEEQRWQLRGLRCGYAQGYLFSRPLDAAAATKLLDADASTP